MCGCQPVIFPPQYCVHDSYTMRNVPFIHPVVHVNRQNIINVPQHIFPQMTTQVVVDRGCPGASLRR